MAATTTLMTSPIFEWLVGTGRHQLVSEPEPDISADTQLEPIR
jgi:hypothetical protein